LIVKKSDSYRLFTIVGLKTRDDEKLTSFPKLVYGAFSFYGRILKT